MIRENGIAKKIDPKVLGEMLQFVFHPLLTMVEIFARDRVNSEQEATTDRPIKDMNDSNLIGREHFNTSQPSHKTSPHRIGLMVKVYQNPPTSQDLWVSPWFIPTSQDLWVSPWFISPFFVKWRYVVTKSHLISLSAEAGLNTSVSTLYKQHANDQERDHEESSLILIHVMSSMAERLQSASANK